MTALFLINEQAALPVPLLLTALAAAALLLAIWWIRERRLSAQRREMRAFHALSEEIIAAASPAEIAERLVRVLPTITQANTVRLYLFNRRTKSLERVPTAADPDPMAVPVDAPQHDGPQSDAPQDGLSRSAVVCFRNRTLLNIPEVRRSPFVRPDGKSNLPRSAMLVPMFAQHEVAGVLELGNAHRPGYFSPEEQAAAQHLANQVAASLKLQEQQSMREQLFRSEKLAATGQLISGVASELRAPLESILQLATSLAAYQGRVAPARDLNLLAGESHRASEIVARLISFARPEDSEARPVDVNSLVAGLVEFRGPEWRTLGLRVQNRLSPEPAPVLGAQGQIEQAFLNLLVHAEQRAVEASPKTLAVSSSVIARRLLVEIVYSTTVELDPFVDGLGVCQGIIHNHGGEIRFRAHSGTGRFEVDLPVARLDEENTAAGETRKAVRPLTVMLVDSAGQRQLLGMLSARGHRVVPVTPEEAVELAQRLRFDALLFASRPGVQWREFQDRIRACVPVFVLVNDGHDANLARSLEENGGFLLVRPIQDSDLDRVLTEIEARSQNSPARPER